MRYSPPSCILLLFFLLRLRLHPRHMAVPRLGVELDLQLPAWTTATATPDPSHICHLHGSLQQCQILNPLSQVEPTSSKRQCQVFNLLNHNGNSGHSDSWSFFLWSFRIFSEGWSSDIVQMLSLGVRLFHSLCFRCSFHLTSHTF